MAVGGKSAFGDYNFDPLGFASKSPEMVPWYREAELKHGRMAMLAVTGLITTEFVRVPGDIYQVASRCVLQRCPPRLLPSEMTKLKLVIV